MQALSLFTTFFKIGLFTFGGGQAMIPLIMKEVERNSWFSTKELLDFIAISETTPGPFAINIATYTGYTTHGFLGAFLATLGVILPSFIIIMTIVLFANLIKKNVLMKKTLSYMSSSVTGIIASVFVSLFILIVFNMTSFSDFKNFKFNETSLILIFILFPISKLKINERKFSAVWLILVSGLLGLVFYYL